MKRGVISFSHAPGILSSASVVGRKEHEGPLGPLFDLHDGEDRFGKPTFEQAESEMQRLSLNLALSKVQGGEEAVDAVFAGDLLNQCTGSAYGLLGFDAPYFGLYGACSTAVEGMILASIALSSGVFRRAVVTTSSHNCTAERQFRAPVEYGGQRAPTAQWTATAAASFLLGEGKSIVYITQALPGRAIDSGIRDMNDMGAAMAPAAVDTMTRYFEGTGMKPGAFDLILTGDLGQTGSAIVRDLMRKNGYETEGVYTDCGLLLYDAGRQDVHAGGSGCGCSAAVLSAYVLDLFRRGAAHDVLFLGTGAMMSPMSVQQGGTIPGICHLIRLTKERML